MIGSFRIADKPFGERPAPIGHSSDAIQRFGLVHPENRIIVITMRRVLRWRCVRFGNQGRVAEVLHFASLEWTVVLSPHAEKLCVSNKISLKTSRSAFGNSTTKTPHGAQ